MNQNLDTLHADLTFPTHLKQTSLWNGTLHETDPYKGGINKVFANKHSKYFITLNSKSRSKAVESTTDCQSQHPHFTWMSIQKSKASSCVRYVFLGKIKINSSPFCCSLTKLNSTKVPSVERRKDFSWLTRNQLNENWVPFAITLLCKCAGTCLSKKWLQEMCSL